MDGWGLTYTQLTRLCADHGCRYCQAELGRTPHPPPDPDSAPTFDQVEAAGLDGTLRNMVRGELRWTQKPATRR